MEELNPKVCFFCNNPSSRKLVLNPQTKVLNDVFLTAFYDGHKYPVCEACAALWDAELNAINAEWKRKIDKLFENMILKKGVIVSEEAGKDS